MAVISVENASHYQWGSGCDGWRLAETDALSVIEERMPPGASEVRHAHAHSEQFIYVLLGDARVEVEGEEHQLIGQQGVHIAPGRMHQVSNRGAGELVFLMISTPPAKGDRIVEDDG